MKEATPVPEAEELDPTAVAGPLGARSESTFALDSTRITRAGGVTVQGLGALVGSVWGDFEIGELIGRGGMGAVFRGRQISLDRPVAIKVLLPDLAEQAETRERFIREARAIAQILSPHIIMIHHAGVHAGWHFYAMELVTGHDLARKLGSGWRPTTDEANDLMLQAARGLAAAGRWGIVHRDIKPANMLLTPEGCLKLTDFGLVRRPGEQQLTSQGLILGTAGYISPEQAVGGTCDARSDIYSLGVVFYELLAGRPPFTADSSAGVIYQHIHELPVSIEVRNPAVTPDLSAICSRMLAKQPEKRYQSADDLVKDLEAAAAGRPLPHTAVHRRSSASRLRFGVLVLVILAMPATAAAVWWRHRQEEVRVDAMQAARQAAAMAEAERVAEQRTAAEARRHDAWGRFATLVVSGSTFRLREIPPGRCRIGSPDDEASRSRDETRMTVSFTTIRWMSDSEVTQAQWRATMGSLPHQEFPGPDLPVTGIPWSQAVAFCSHLQTLVSGLSVRLPTEAEWEYCAHAGTSGPWAGGRELPTQGWYSANAGGQLHPPRQFPPNPWGIYDLHGNVAEWTADSYVPRHDAEEIDPAPVTGDDRKTVKGGSWDDDPADCRIAHRLRGSNGGSKYIGFRLYVTELPSDLR